MLCIENPWYSSPVSDKQRVSHKVAIVLRLEIMCSVTELCLGPVLDNDMFSHTDHMEDCDLSVVNAHAVSMSCTASCEQL
jgi:hypothetical protein